MKVSSPDVEVRTDCRNCKGPLKGLFSIGEQEVISLGDKPRKTSLLRMMKCERCGLAQLDRTVDREYLFGTYYYRSKATATMREHLKGIVDEASKRVALQPGDIVLDIGSNDGFTLEQYQDSPVRIGFEPSSAYQASSWTSSGATNDFFSAQGFAGTAEKFTQKRQARIITTLSIFYDLDDPNTFLKDVKRVLAPDGLFVLQINYLPDTLRNNAVGDICHEHVCYYTLTTLSHLLIRNGMGIEDVRFSPINGGSVIAFVRPWLFPVNPPSVVDAMLDEINLDDESFRDFYERVKDRAERVRAFFIVGGILRNRVFDIISASTRGATFIQMASLQGYARFVVERDASKVGKTYLGVPIVSEETSNQSPPDFKLVSPTWFLSEIKEREKAFLDGGGGLVVPLPEPMLVTKDAEKPL